jgi:hypothetical protein
MLTQSWYFYRLLHVILVVHQLALQLYADTTASCHRSSFVCSPTVDASKYSDADWESMRSTAAESVLGRSLRRKSSRVAKPGSQEWGYEEVT